MATALPSLLGAAARLAIDAVLPPRCLGCRRIVGTGGALCPACWGSLTFLGPPHCACCGRPFDVEMGQDSLCGACLERRPAFSRARAVFLYDDASKGLVLRFKHADHTASAPHFARWMARAGHQLLAEADLLVPVPLHPLRLFSRRYNQAALLANALARHSGVACRPDGLRRSRFTPSQGMLGRNQRRDNVRGAFQLAGAVAGRRVLLVDDVLTSGATTDECARTLLDGGAAAVDILTLARVVSAR